MADLFSSLGSIATVFWQLLAGVVDLILANPILLVGTVLGVTFGAVTLIIALVKKLGVRSVGGRARRRRR